MRYAYAKMTFHMMFISFLAFIFMGCGESGTPGGASGPGVTASISLNAGSISLPADGVSSTPITAVLTDSVGAAVTQQTSVVFRTNLGTFRNGAKEYKIDTADATGRVIVQLTTEETPGNAEVWAESNKVKQKIEVKFFDPHKVGTISLRTGSSSITADGSSQVAVIATVNDALGNPEAGAEVNFKTTLGQFYEENPLFPGILNRNTTAITDVDGEAVVMLISGKTIGTATILASLDGLNTTANVVFTAGEPDTISLRAAPSTIRPNGTTNLFAKLRDINGNPVEGKTIVFSEFINASGGALNSLSNTTNVNGEAQVTYTAGKDPGADIIQAAMSSNLDMNATTTIVVDPGAIVIGGITVTTGSASLVADGKGKVKIRALVTDIDGEPASGKTVNFATTAGTLSSASATTSEFGLAEITLQATTISGPATIYAECDGFIGDASVEFIPGPADHLIMYAFPDVVPPNGAFSTAVIIQDQYDNRIDDQRLMLQVRRAGFTEIVDSAELTPDQAEDGVYRFDWTAATAYGLGNLEITAKVNNGVSKTVTVVVDEDAIIVGSINVIAGATAIEADGKSSVAIRATVLDYNGQPAEGITVDFATTLGTLSSGQAITDQNGFAEVVLKAGTVWGTATVTADANGFKDQVEVLFTTGQAGGLRVTAMPSIVTPGGQSTIIAELRSTSGQPVAGELLYFNIYENNSNGSLSAIQAVTDTNGRATVTYTAGVEADLCGGGGVCSESDCIEVTLASDSSIRDTTCITVSIPTGTVGYMTLTSAKNSLPADGSSSTSVTAIVYDTAGFPMPEGTTITFSTTLGTFPGGTDPAGPITSQLTLTTIDDSGTIITSLIAGTVGGVAQIKAISGGVSQILNIIINDGSVTVGSIVLTANPTSIPADGASSTAITAVIKDTLGNPVPIGTPVVFTTTLGTFADSLFPTIALYTTDTTGTVTTSLIAGLVDGVAFVTATAGNMTQAIEIPILEEITGGLSVTANPTSLVANGTSTSLIRATLTDSNGNPISGVNVAFATTLGTIIGGPTVATNASGVADVILQSTTTTGTAAVTATANGITATVNVTFTSGAPGSLLLAAAPSTVNPGGGACSTSCCESTSTLTATLRDTEGNPMPGQAITFIITTDQSGGSLSGPSAVTNINGQATITFTAGNEVGTDRVTARSVTDTTISDYVDIVVDASASVVGSITVTSGVSSLVANGTSQTAIRATVLNSCGNPMSGVTVNFDTTLGTLSSTSALTNASGIAQVTLTSAANTGTAKVTAEASGFVAGVNVAFVAGAPNSLVLNAAPSTVNPEGTSTVMATLLDVNNNPLVGETISFNLTINASGASLSAVSGVTNVNGQATITYTAGNANPVTDRVTARSVTNTAITDFVDITVDASANVVGGVTVISGASSLVANGTSTTLIRATVIDTDGNPAPGVTVDFATTLGTLVGAPSVTTNASGIAEVTLRSTTTTGTANVTATASGFMASVNVAFVAGAPTSMLITAAPSTVNPKGTSTVTATLRDANSNPLVGETISFNLTINASGASLSVVSGVTNINGQATITYTAGNTDLVTDRVTARSVRNTAITDFVDINVDASATVVGSVSLTANPTSIPADGSSSSVITATVKDTGNNPMPVGTPVTFTTTSGTFPGGVDPDGAGPLTSQVTINTTGATGIVVTSLISAVTSGTASVTATSSGVSQTVQVTMTGGGLVVSQIDVIIENTTLNADGVSTTNVYAYAKTALNQAVPNVAITFETSHGTITTPLTTDASGKATAVLTSSRENIDPVTVTARYNLVSDSASMKFVGVTLTLTANPTSQVLGFDSTITATLLDAANKPIAGAIVSFSTSNPGAVTVPTTVTTNVSGKGIVVLQNSTVTGDVTVTGTSSGATGTAVVNFGDYQLAFEPSSPAIINVGGGAGGTSTITIRLRQYGTACPGGVAAVPVNFSSTLGTITVSSVTGACTAAAGYIYADATATLTSGAQGGTAVINAYVDIAGVRYEATTSVSIVSPTANKIILEPDPSVISVNTGISNIRARVLDSADNPVANKIIYFGILQGPGGSEYLTPSFATTDADGRCVAYFHAGSITSDNIGDVIIQASDNQAFASPVGSCNLTISGQVHHVSVGVNLQSLPSPALTQGHLQVGVSGIAVDINGNPVADGTLLIFSVKSIEFDEDRADDGIIECWNAPGQLAADLIACPAPLTPGFGTTWFSDDINQNGILDFAGSEDINNNGILDSGEDLNGNGVMDPPQGNLIVSPKATTDGVAETDLIYPMQYAANIRVRITASAGGKTNFYDYYLLCTTTMVTQGTCGRAY